jgi:hypothetical protein
LSPAAGSSRRAVADSATPAAITASSKRRSESLRIAASTWLPTLTVTPSGGPPNALRFCCAARSVRRAKRACNSRPCQQQALVTKRHPKPVHRVGHPLPLLASPLKAKKSGRVVVEDVSLLLCGQVIGLLDRFEFIRASLAITSSLSNAGSTKTSRPSDDNSRRNVQTVRGRRSAAATGPSFELLPACCVITVSAGRGTLRARVSEEEAGRSRASHPR